MLGRYLISAYLSDWRVVSRKASSVMETYLSDLFSSDNEYDWNQRAVNKFEEFQI